MFISVVGIIIYGGVAEWFKVLVSKTRVWETAP